MHSNHFTDDLGHPAGGITYGTGFCIAWQNGPLGRGKKRQEPNGAFVEEIIQAAYDRLQFYQQTQFVCNENEDAIYALEDALFHLRSRTERRKEAKTEGTHRVD